MSVQDDRHGKTKISRPDGHRDVEMTTIWDGNRVLLRLPVIVIIAGLPSNYGGSMTEEYEEYEIDEFDLEPVPLIGRKLPDFELDAYQDGKEKKIRLSGYKGKWLVLVFYPADFTFICPTELEELAEHYKEFQEADAEVLSISTDTVYVHKAWHDQSPAIKKITFPMVADPAGKISRALGVYLEDEGLDLRGSFITDPDGMIKAMEIHDNSIGRSATELLRKLQAAKYVYDNGGVNVCPANWHPGEKTLKPGMDLVGKI